MPNHTINELRVAIVTSYGYCIVGYLISDIPGGKMEHM